MGRDLGRQLIQNQGGVILLTVLIQRKGKIFQDRSGFGRKTKDLLDFGSDSLNQLVAEFSDRRYQNAILILGSQ